MATSRICSIPDCGKPEKARGWCSIHYERWRKHSDPLVGRARWGEPERYLQETVLPYDGDSCLTWPYARSHGYAIISRDGQNFPVSRLVCEDEHGPPPTSEHQGAHSCGRGHLGCVTRRHLRWATRTENAADKVIHSTINRGERHGQSKLNADQVRQIRSLLGTMSQTAIGARFGVTRGAVKDIARRKNWAWMD